MIAQNVSEPQGSTTRKNFLRQLIFIIISIGLGIRFIARVLAHGPDVAHARKGIA